MTSEEISKELTKVRNNQIEMVKDMYIRYGKVPPQFHIIGYDKTENKIAVMIIPLLTEIISKEHYANIIIPSVVSKLDELLGIGIIAEAFVKDKDMKIVKSILISTFETKNNYDSYEIDINTNNTLGEINHNFNPSKDNISGQFIFNHLFKT